MASLTPEQAERLLFEWRFWAREAQLPPAGEWFYWLLLAGRGFGKTRTAVEWVRDRVDRGARRLILAGATAGDVRDIMVDGESGILAKSPPWNRPIYEPSKARLTWKSGAIALLLSADEPERFRGKQSDTAWCDELAAWRYPEAWDQLQLGLRLGHSYGVVPQCIVSTTPKPTPVIRELASDPLARVTGGSTYENEANLAPAFIKKIISKYEGTRIGLQELYAKILDDAPGALWKRAVIDARRVRAAPALKKIVVAVDPAVSSHSSSAETGIVVLGIGEDGHGYVLADESGRYTPDEWGKKVVELFRTWDADYVVAEVNQGGDLVTSNVATAARDLKAQNVKVGTILVVTVRATRGKAVRAEPVAALYEQGRIHHVGIFAKKHDADTNDPDQLEDQMCTWEPAEVSARSPDRVDALVWGFTDLMIDHDAGAVAGRARTIPSRFRQFGGNPFAPTGHIKW